MFRDETRYRETTCFQWFLRKREILLKFVEIDFEKRAAFLLNLAYINLLIVSKIKITNNTYL